MSIKMIDLVFKHWDGAGGSVMLVLLALADYADEKGENCYPSVETVGRKARISENQARRILHELEDVGAISVVANHAGGRHQNTRHYRINIRTIVAGVAKATETISSLKKEKRTKKTTTTATTSEGRNPISSVESAATGEGDERVSPVKESGIAGESQTVSNRQKASAKDQGQEHLPATPLRSVASSSEHSDDPRPTKRWGSRGIGPLLRMRFRQAKFRTAGFTRHSSADIAALVNFGDINKRVFGNAPPLKQAS